jgi:hypothetical protein
LLSSHFDEESSIKNFFVIAVSNEVNGINLHLKNNLK